MYILVLRKDGFLCIITLEELLSVDKYIAFTGWILDRMPRNGVN